MDTLNRDVLFLLGVEMELPTLLNFCKTSSRINKKVCKDNNVWLHKLRKEFSDAKLDENFLKNKSPKDKYIILYSLRDVKEKLKRKETLEELYNLEYLSLNNNELKEIPATIGNLFNLEFLCLIINWNFFPIL